MRKIFIIILLWLFIFMACKQADQSANQEKSTKIQVASVNYPLHYFAQRIGGEHIEAVYPISAEGDPAYWKPDEKGISIFQQADVILLNGAGYAKWIDKVSLPTSKMLNTSEGLKENYIELNEGTTHSHGPEGDHVHKGYAFTTWLNMKFAIRQAESIKTRLNQLLPDQQDAFEKNFIDLKTDLGILDDQLTTIAGDLRNTSLFGSHPVYQYLANGYGLTILSEHWEPDQKVSEKQWSLFIDNLKRHPGTIMLWEGPPLPEVEKRLLSSGIKAVVFNPCGNTPESGDFLSVMNKNLTNLKDNL